MKRFLIPLIAALSLTTAVNAGLPTSKETWISLDNEIRILSEQVKELRDKRNEIHNDIIRYVETNE